MDLKEEDILGEGIDAHWYYRSKYAAVARLCGGLCPRSVLDVGAGSGFFAKRLLEASTAAEAVCVDPGYSGDSREQWAGKPLSFVRDVAEVDADLVLLMDVLEHVDDDIGLLRDDVSRSRPGTHFLITVPAFAFLWSGHDVFLEHRRRYTRPQLEGVARTAGLNIVTSCYFFGLILPLVAATRLGPRLRPGAAPQPASSLRRHGAVANTILGAVCALELPFMTMNKLGGLSVFCLARS